MTATVSFEVARADNALMVPNAAMRFNPVAAPADSDFGRPGKARKMQPRVFKLDAGRLVEVPIEPGLTDGSFTEVRSGELQEKDAVVIEQSGGPRPTPGVVPRTPRLGG
jgi:HlyD family secretion protein